ncbi:hypothetical protein [Sphingobacterium spiritivorum]|uniref:hypothetical protein n=1 Tax=Sphingobacterium spiritivorum TaxID=258 RepID=UPI003DA61E4C
MKITLKILSSFLLILFFQSCKKEEIKLKSEDIDLKNISNNELYNQFAILLSKAVNDSPPLRKFIKDQALKKFDNDHDILYNYVKDEKIDSQNSLKEFLSNYQEYPNQLTMIESAIPTLTIFVPTLTESNFSPENWNSDKDIPLVSTNLIKRNGEIPVFEDGDEIFSLKSNETPGFPILVVKPNERVNLRKNIKSKSANINKESFEFISPAFNGLIKTKSTYGTNYTIDPSITNAYNVFGVDISKWQRDHVYYKLTNDQTTGPLQRNMREAIAMLKISRAGLNKISDQSGDPILTNNPNKTIELPNNYDRTQLEGIVQRNAWSDGSFEFRFDVLINNKSGAGTALAIYLPVKPTDLFRIGYNHTIQTKNGKKSALVVYQHNANLSSGRGFESKEFLCNLPIINWDLQNNSFIWKISLAEVDATETITYKESITREFATNFNLDLKIGLKFGASNKESKTDEFTILKTIGEDDLGHILLNFSDPIITNMSSQFNSTELMTYKNEYFEILVLPQKYY